MIIIRARIQVRLLHFFLRCQAFVRERMRGLAGELPAWAKRTKNRFFSSAYFERQFNRLVRIP